MVLQELNPGLIPQDETVRAVLRGLPKGEVARRGASGQLLVASRPTPITHKEGHAAEWPNRFARHGSVPDAWSDKADWFFWVVVTDKQLHAFEGRIRKRWNEPVAAGPEGAHYPLDQIAEMTFKKGLISQLAIYFKDGSSVELEFGNQKLDLFLEAIAPFVKADSTRPQATGWAPRGWWWAVAIALLVGGMAMSLGGQEDGTVVLVIGIVAIVLGTFLVLRAWHSGGWKRRRWGIPVALLGLILLAASFDGNCECSGMVYIGASMALIGIVAQFGRRAA
jgi:hypothetical protein